MIVAKEKYKHFNIVFIDETPNIPPNPLVGLAIAEIGESVVPAIIDFGNALRDLGEQLKELKIALKDTPELLGE
jgi:hypothetical protein